VVLRRAIVVTTILIALGSCTEVCSFEDRIRRFFVDHPDAIDCQFAHRIFGLGEDEVVGAQAVHDCILESIAESQSFVGGYVLYGIDAGKSVAYLGAVKDEAFDFSVLVEHPEVFKPITIYRSRCHDIADRSMESDIGLECLGSNLVEACAE
jgi:hypothetical protein